ncbi:MAG: glycoside hydrolase family 2 protein [Bacteroides sp.]|nr:glycoside hydrolase family 2 protein [Bacteroides sp.]
MNRSFIITSIISILPFLESSAKSDSRILIDRNWEFINEDTLSLLSDKSNHKWQLISLPHDWSVLNDFNINESSGNDGGYLPTGKGIYRKTINIPDNMVGKPCEIYFEGIYMNSEVLCNGYYVGGHPYGYTSFRCDLTPFLKAGDNDIMVKVDNSKQKNSRWYSGSGIYRHVWLEPHGEIYIKPWSMQITTPIVSSKNGVARIDFKLVNAMKNNKKESLRIPIDLNVNGPLGLSESIIDTITFQSGETIKYCSYEINVDTPALWSVDSPTLYTAQINLTLPDGKIETESDTFGFRTIKYSAEEGFKLNDKFMLISGACLHHDNGILGAASYDDAEIRKAKLIKDAGFNAVRTSHNPPAPAFLAACDSIGLLVIDEAFDGWKVAKNPFDYSILYDEWWDKDIACLVERDRNHPSVICWSIGNEIIERKSSDAVKIAAELASKCREFDLTRPITSALAAWDSDWEIYDPLASKHDIVGYNYMIHKSESDHQRVPSRVMWQTESYPRDAFQNWEMVNDNNYIIGDFVWTGIDYIGESGIGRYYYEGEPNGEHWHRPLWPWHNSYCGDIDIIGQRKPISHYRELLYNANPKLYMAVREPNGYYGEIKETIWGTYPTHESWSWPRYENNPIVVEIISNYPAVELYSNGNLIGKKETTRKNKYKAVFELPYQPGEIVAVAVDESGNQMESQKLTTAGKPYALRLVTDKDTIDLSSQSLAYITVEVIDKNGIVVPNYPIKVKFSVSDGAEIIATGSRNPKDPVGYYHSERLTDSGKALCIIKLTGEKPNNNKNIVNFTASAPGVKSATLSLSIK